MNFKHHTVVLKKDSQFKWLFSVSVVEMVKILEEHIKDTNQDSLNSGLTVKIMNRFNEFSVLTHFDDRAARVLRIKIFFRFTLKCRLSVTQPTTPQA